jgi:hypothetical protein
LKLRNKLFFLIFILLAQNLLVSAEPTPLNFKATISGLIAERSLENVKAELLIGGNLLSRNLSRVSKGERLKVVFEDLKLGSSITWLIRILGVIDGVNATLFWARGLIKLDGGNHSIKLFGYDFNPDAISIDAESPVISFTSIRTAGVVSFQFKVNLNKPVAYASILALDLDGDGVFSGWEATIREGLLEGGTLNVSSAAFLSQMPLANFALNLSFNDLRVASLAGSINFTSGDLVNVRSGHEFNCSLIPTIIFAPLLNSSILELAITGRAFTIEGGGATTTTNIKPLKVIVTVEEGLEVKGGVSEFASRLNPSSLILFIALALGIPTIAVLLIVMRGWMKRFSRRGDKR